MASGFKMDPKALRQIEKDVAAKLQPKADRASADAIDAVRTRMSGGGYSEDQVMQALRSQLQHRFESPIQFDEAQLRTVASEIVAG